MAKAVVAPEIIYSDREVVLRREARDGRRVLVRAFRSERPSQREIAGMRYGAELSQSLDVPGVAGVIGVDAGALVMEDFGGAPLAVLAASGRLGVAEALRIAAQVARTLGELHRRGVIHKSVDPASILVAGKSDRIALANFDIASRLASESPSLSDVEGRPHKLAYISPEQTARMNRAVDYRTDLYSLGVTLYELLTGGVPFRGADAIALVHAHIAMEPAPCDRARPDIPAAVSDVVMKLLAKDPEDRYQSAYGLTADLEECLRQLEATGTVVDLAVGARDVPAGFSMPQKLYGRAAESAQLIAAFDRVGSGQTELVLVSGWSGIGKSALVNEIHRPLSARRGLFGAGKFEQLQSVPCGALIQAFQGVIREVLSESDDQIAAVRDALAEVLGPVGQVIVDVIPELSLIVGPQPPVPALGPSETRARFNVIYKRMVSVFATAEHPLVLFLDDLQWADSASLDLLQLMLGDASSRHLLVIGAYRHAEVTASHPLMVTLDAVRKGSARITEIALSPLGAEDVEHMVSDALRGGDVAGRRDLARLVFQKTEGNPFLVKQLLAALYARKLVTFDAEAGAWRWSLERIEAEGVTENMATLLVDRIKKLDAGAQRVLPLAAASGATFELDVVALVAGVTAHVAAAHLWEAVVAGLVTPIGDAYKFYATRKEIEGDAPPSVQYRFLHDRIQEAAYALLDEGEKKRVHLAIGRHLLRRAGAEEREARIFDIVNQLDVAADLLQEPGERRALVELNLVAGRRAKTSLAYGPAARYLDAGLALLASDAWETDHTTVFTLHRLRAECDYLLGRHDEAEAAFERLLGRARTREDRIELFVLLMALFTSNGKYDKSMKAGREGLRDLGLDLPPPEGLGAAVAAEMGKLVGSLPTRRIVDILDAAEIADPDERARIRFLAKMNVYGSYNDPNLFQLLSLMLVNRTFEHGVAPGSAPGFANVGLFLGGATGDYASSFELGRVALELSERLEDHETRGTTSLIFGNYISPWRRPIRAGIPYIDRAYVYCLESGSIAYAFASAIMLVWQRFLAGEELTALVERARKHVEFILGMNVLDLAYFVAVLERTMHLFIHGEMPRDRADWADAEVFLDKHLKYAPAVNAHHVHTLQIAYLFGDTAKAEAAAAKAGETLLANFGHPVLIEYSYYHALLLAELLHQSSGEEADKRRAALAEHREKIARWADNAPENVGHKKLLVDAEVARIEGREAEVGDLYDEAAAGAEANGFIQDQALANELAARFYLSKKRPKIARAYLLDARRLYARWGAAAKVAALDRRHADLLPAEDARAGEHDPGAALDLTTVMKASQAISSEIVQDDLLRRLMSVILENAGAQRGFLALRSEGELRVEAVAQGEGVELHAGPLEGRSDLSKAVVRYVARTRERVVIGDAAAEGAFASDPYMARAKPRSVLCVPIVRQQELAGVLYLENNLVAQAFTEARCRMLSTLAAQAAISLENARLYHTLDARVKERTRELRWINEELSRALRHLKETQKQLVMQEKLASLGALTAGIAHEIKNPLQFVNNFAELSVGLAGDLEGSVRSQEARLDADAIADIEETLGFLTDNVRKIHEHGKRVEDIVNGMLSHARNAPSAREDADVNALVVGSINLAVHGLRVQDPELSVGLRTEYDGAAGRARLSSQEISRVLINVINNAVYATAARKRTAGEGYAPGLLVSTRGLPDRVEIRVRDNGTGIAADVLGKIFVPFFTTKPAGQGTGLGLSISHDIVQSHHGEMHVESVLGEFTEVVIALPRRVGGTEPPAAA